MVIVTKCEICRRHAKKVGKIQRYDQKRVCPDCKRKIKSRKIQEGYKEISRRFANLRK